MDFELSKEGTGRGKAAAAQLARSQAWPNERAGFLPQVPRSRAEAGTWWKSSLPFLLDVFES